MTESQYLEIEEEHRDEWIAMLERHRNEELEITTRFNSKIGSKGENQLVLVPVRNGRSIYYRIPNGPNVAWVRPEPCGKFMDFYLMFRGVALFLLRSSLNFSNEDVLQAEIIATQKLTGKGCLMLETFVEQ